MTKKSILLLVTLMWPVTLFAQPNPWAFDFDPLIAADPGHVNQHLQTLQQGLPGLPTNAGIVEVTTGSVKLYFFEDVITMLNGARDSGPAFMPPVQRQPSICVEHGAFQKPDLDTDGNFLCEAAEAALMATFAEKKVNTCFYVEFPESFVYDHSPIGSLDIPMVSNWNTLIGVLGEALSYITYPENILPADFFPVMRNILAKLRYTELKAQIADQRTAYQNAITSLQTDILCYDQGKVATFTATITKMIAELNAAEQHLEGIYQAGVAQAIVDRKAVENQGRIRVDLPFPALTDRDRELLAFYIGGVSWRVRGGGLLNANMHDSLYRRLLFVMYPYGLIAELAGGVTDAKDLGFQLFIDASSGYKDWFDMGTSPGRDKYSDLVQMTDRGKRLTTLAAPTLAARGYDTRPLVAGGLQMGLCYYYVWEELYWWNGPYLLGFKLGEDMDDHTIYPDHVRLYLEQPISTGEPCTGGALALGLVRTYLWGKEGGTVCTPNCTGKPCGSEDGCGTLCSTCADLGVTPVNDAGVPIDIGVATDAVPPPPTDAEPSVQADQATDAPQVDNPDEGCSCQTSGVGTPSGLLLWLLVPLFVLRRRSRRSVR